MTLATRCTACGTTFRVVQDQLRVSEGWVRCGRCNEVFSALETLSELPDEEAALRNEPMPQAAGADEPLRRGEVLLDPPSGWSASQPAPIADELPSPGQEGAQWLPAASAPPPPPSDAATPGSARHGFETTPLSAEDRSPLSGSHPGEEAPPQDSEVHVEIPAFVREADASRSAASPARRRALAAGSVVAALLLAGQAVHAWRDAIATWVPASRPALAAACDWISCQLSPWRQLEGLSVESSSLGQVGSTTIYQLSVVLRNRTRLELMAPSLDLALTDSQGRTVARRVLSVSELGAQAGPMPPGSELSLQARLSTGDRRITGYALEIFHP